MCNVLLIKSCSNSKREPSACWPIKLRMFRFSIFNCDSLFICLPFFSLYTATFAFCCRGTIISCRQRCILHPASWLHATGLLNPLIVCTHIIEFELKLWAHSVPFGYNHIMCGCNKCLLSFLFVSFRFVVVLSPHFCSHFANGQLYTQIFCPRWQSFFPFILNAVERERERDYTIYIFLFFRGNAK